MIPILAFDPGPKQTGIVRLEGIDAEPLPVGAAPSCENCTISVAAIAKIQAWTLPNQELCARLGELLGKPYPVALLEVVEARGMPVGNDTLHTQLWAGYIGGLLASDNVITLFVRRSRVKLALCGTARAKDSNIRAALIDLLGGKEAVKKGGIAHGIHGHQWAALATAFAYLLVPDIGQPAADVYLPERHH
jgi:hypothetical protein